LQTELEECTETLSEQIARPYLRTPRSKIIHTAHLVQRKRHEFVTAISKGLVPPDTSPAANRKRKKQYSVELDVSAGGGGGGRGAGWRGGGGGGGPPGAARGGE
jgi:hypothetical protein